MPSTWTVEGAASASDIAVSSKGVTLTTANSHDLAVCFVHITHSSGTPTLTSVTSGSLTWTKRGGLTAAGNSGHNHLVELWTAPIAGTVSETVTANAGGTYNHVSIGVYGVKSDAGGWNESNPFDSHSGLPATFSQAGGGNVNTNLAANVPAGSSTSASVLAISCWGTNASPGDRADTPDSWIASGWTVDNTAGTDWSRMAPEHKQFTSAQTNLPFLYRDFANGYIILGDFLNDTVSTISSTVAMTLGGISMKADVTVENKTTAAMILFAPILALTVTESMPSTVAMTLFPPTMALTGQAFGFSVAMTLFGPSILAAGEQATAAGNKSFYSWWFDAP